MNPKRWQLIVLFLLLAGLVAVPFLLRPPGAAAPANARQLVIISPHNEAVLREFESAFRRWHEQHYGETAFIDWRNLGGTSEIVRYLDSEYEAAQRAGRPGIGLDLFFGGGQYDHARQAAKGHTVPCGLRERHPEWLAAEIIPRTFGGEEFYDAQDRWYGCCLSSFGLCYNADVLRTRGLSNAPRQWADLTDFRYFRQVALADPTKSGSIAKAFEMLIQEQMQAELAERGPAPDASQPAELAAGWRRGLNVLRRIGANARYFTDSAGKVPTDVAQGNAAAGMCIDYYGRFESESAARNAGAPRMHYLTPAGGSSFSVDPISLLQGAPHRELAERFIDFCLSPEGQQLWDYRAGEPGGPVRYALRRLPIRRDLYTPEHLRHLADPEALPYAQSRPFVYQSQWTGPLFSVIRVLIRSMCLDTHEELAAAWAAINRAGGPAACPAAMAAFNALPPEAEYAAALATTARRLNNKLEEVRLAREWVVFFRAQYRQAGELAAAKHDQR
jgi:ABC-type Fe3+ transport system substrate-binding protein